MFSVSIFRGWGGLLLLHGCRTAQHLCHCMEHRQDPNPNVSALKGGSLPLFQYERLSIVILFNVLLGKQLPLTDRNVLLKPAVSLKKKIEIEWRITFLTQGPEPDSSPQQYTVLISTMFDSGEELHRPRLSGRMCVLTLMLLQLFLTQNCLWNKHWGGRWFYYSFLSWRETGDVVATVVKTYCSLEWYSYINLLNLSRCPMGCWLLPFLKAVSTFLPSLVISAPWGEPAATLREIAIKWGVMHWGLSLFV